MITSNNSDSLAEFPSQYREIIKPTKTITVGFQDYPSRPHEYDPLSYFISHLYTKALRPVSFPQNNYLLSYYHVPYLVFCYWRNQRLVHENSVHFWRFCLTH